MRAFSEAYPEEEFVQQVAAQIPLVSQLSFAGQGQRPGQTFPSTTRILFFQVDKYI